MRSQTQREQMHNLLFRHNGTATPGIAPARRVILALIQTLRPTLCRDDVATWNHFRGRYGREADTAGRQIASN